MSKSCLEPPTAATQFASCCDYKMLTRDLNDCNLLANLDLVSDRFSVQSPGYMPTNLVLCDEDRDHFLEALRNPPKPNQKLIEAFSYYYERKMKDA
jgi:hypothetical protein